MSHADSLLITSPQWLRDYARETPPIAGDEARMVRVIGAARENVARGDGGPFAAGVFERDSGVLVALGVNMVATAGLSILHAEMMAVSLAQKKLGTFDLGAKGFPAHELVTSAAPCAMCLGAVPWSGVTRVVMGARGEDVEAVGFDEGAKPYDWEQELEKRGIEVVADVMRADAASVLKDYAARGGEIYNSAHCRKG
ncbi:nucleoside deaminase [Hyphococcus sp.]|uniref:nucleoside deaminase n=1 Tax=Hyphococcus sp. TaxID=2038636 RepID=UPI00208D0BD6|nr:MAG: tRNA-specific adenosine deaminase [Marinicaulis sp.]